MFFFHARANKARLVGATSEVASPASSKACPRQLCMRLDRLKAGEVDFCRIPARLPHLSPLRSEPCSASKVSPCQLSPMVNRWPSRRLTNVEKEGKKTKKIIKKIKELEKNNNKLQKLSMSMPAMLHRKANAHVMDFRSKLARWTTLANFQKV